MTQLPHSLRADARLELPARLDAPDASICTGDLHIAHFAEAFGGGLLEMVRLVCLGHAEAGIRVSLLHGRRPETPLDLQHVPEVRGVTLQEIPGWGDRRPGSELRAIRAVRRWLRSEDVDVAVFHSSFAGMAGALAGWPGTKVFTPHAFASRVPGGRTRRLVFESAERLACRRHDVVACVSHSEAQIAHRLGAGRVATIPNGIAGLDDPAWPDDPVPPARPRVVGVGRLVHQSRPVASARILGALRDVADVAWVGGGGSPKYAAHAMEALARAEVELTGWVDQHRAAELLEEATVYLHWTSWDGLPVTVLEAMVADTVVVASDIAPNRELLGPDMVFADEAAATAAIRDLLADPQRWRAALLAQRERATAYSAGRMQRQWNELVMHLADRSPSPVLV